MKVSNRFFLTGEYDSSGGEDLQQRKNSHLTYEGKHEAAGLVFYKQPNMRSIKMKIGLTRGTNKYYH